MAIQSRKYSSAQSSLVAGLTSIARLQTSASPRTSTPALVNSRIFHYVRNQGRASEWNHNIDEAAGPDEILNGFSRAAVQKFDSAGRHSRDPGHDFGKTLIAASGLFPAPQHDRIASLERERRSINRHIWTRFVNNADHAQRNTNLTDEEAVGASPLLQDFIHRIRECDNIAHCLRHLVDPLRGEQ